VFSILGDFVILALGSIGIGLLVGLIGSYILKKFRFLTISAIKETLVIFSMGYLSYSIGELVHVSGIISLLTSGIIMAHYGWYNLSPQGKVLSSASIQVIGFGLEAFVFAYLGLSFFSLYEQDWSYEFILLEAAICIIARFFGTVILLYLTALCKHKRQVSFREVLFVCYAGLIRGAIAFGLVLKLDTMPELVNPINLPVIRTTALTLVISTTLIFGSTMQMVQKALIPPLTDMQIAR
jgi:sodium/hydrogen exchanger-like protein 6/7